MALSKEELTERAQLIRALEAACRIEYPTPQEANFRLALMKKIGWAYKLSEMRKIEITGPVKDPAAPAQQQRPPIRR